MKDLKEFTDAVAASVDARLDDLARRIADQIARMSPAAAAASLNRVRRVLHDAGPFKDEPVDLVLWVPADSVRGNPYNPNTVAPPEMRLLQRSIEVDGYTQPIVTHECDGDEIVDGFHRHRVGREARVVRDRIHEHLPITRIRRGRTAPADRMAATIRHNRARGKHGVDRMTDIVRDMYLAGWSDEQIGKELGMCGDEVTRLKQVTGLAALFAEREFSDAWEPKVATKRPRIPTRPHRTRRSPRPTR